MGYVPLLMAASLPRLARRLPGIGARLRELLDPAARDDALDKVGASMRRIGETVRAKAPQARVMFVDYLTLLPPAGQPAPPLSEGEAELGRRVADRLAAITAAAAADTGCELVPAATASRDHHAWSSDPWTVGAGFPLSFLRGKPAPFHPNAAGMRAVADLVIGLSEHDGCLSEREGAANVDPMRRPSSTTALAATLLPLSSRSVAAGGKRRRPCPPAAPDATHFAESLQKQVSTDAMMGHLQKLQDIANANDGTRAVGTPGYDASVDYRRADAARQGFRCADTGVQGEHVHLGAGDGSTR